LVAAFILEPVYNVRDVLGNIVHVLLKIRIVLQITALIKVRNVHEVPVGLPTTAFVLNLIGEGSALNEGIFVFALRDGLSGHG
jgi:hypothetical protein